MTGMIAILNRSKVVSLTLVGKEMLQKVNTISFYSECDLKLALSHCTFYMGCSIKILTKPNFTKHFCMGTEQNKILA